METLEQLVDEGKIRYYGWSTDDPERARLFADGSPLHSHTNATQPAGRQMLNTLAVCEEFNLAAINRSPLAMGSSDRQVQDGYYPTIR